MLYTDIYRDLALAIARNIFFCIDIDMLRNFLGELHCIYDLFRWFNDNYSMKCMTNMIMHKVYFSMNFISMSQRDCYALLCDISCFAQKVVDYVKDTADREGIETYCHLSLTVSEFLHAVKKHQPAFHDIPPKYIRCIKRSISRDEQLI